MFYTAGRPSRNNQRRRIKLLFKKFVDQNQFIDSFKIQN